MICIRKNGDMLEKYEVVFDKTKLNELIKRVIIKCGEIHHTQSVCEYQYIPKNDRYIGDGDSKSIVHYENVQFKKNGKTTIHYYEYTPFNEDLYDCKYIQYNAPYFAYFIERIICGDVDALAILFDNNMSAIKYFPTVEEKIKRLNETLLEYNGKSIEKQREKMKELSKKYEEYDINSFPTPEKYKKVSKAIKELKALERAAKKEINDLNNELADLLKIRELNRNQEPIDKYFNELVSLVKFELLDTIEISEVDRVSSFLGYKTFEAQKQRILR